MTRQGPSNAAEDPLKTFLPLTPAVFYILVALAEGERHGYAIMQEAAKRSRGVTRLGPGTLYASISRLVTDGLIEESEERPDPKMGHSRRRYYRLTILGERVLVLETKRLEDLVRIAKSTRVVRKLKYA
jgi:DNA-binding PadR family transcriptional regulator